MLFGQFLFILILLLSLCLKSSFHFISLKFSFPSDKQKRRDAAALFGALGRRAASFRRREGPEDWPSILQSSKLLQKKSLIHIEKRSFIMF